MRIKKNVGVPTSQLVQAEEGDEEEEEEDSSRKITSVEEESRKI